MEHATPFQVDHNESAFARRHGDGEVVDRARESPSDLVVELNGCADYVERAGVNPEQPSVAFADDEADPSPV